MSFKNNKEDLREHYNMQNLKRSLEDLLLEPKIAFGDCAGGRFTDDLDLSNNDEDPGSPCHKQNFFCKEEIKCQLKNLKQKKQINGPFL